MQKLIYDKMIKILMLFIQYGTLSRSSWNLEMLVFEEKGKLDSPEKKLLEQGQKTNNKLNPHMTLSPWEGGGKISFS